MKHIPPAERAGTAGKSGSRFSGSVNAFLTMAADGVTINTVDFAPGARTFWHTHEKGQILQVLAGEGRIGTADEVQILRPGDTVWCPPGESHWHGAAPGSFMTHTAISLGVTSWAEEVDDNTYTTASTTITKDEDQ